jgi:hypothetical protein
LEKLSAIDDAMKKFLKRNSGDSGDGEVERRQHRKALPVPGMSDPGPDMFCFVLF